MGHRSAGTCIGLERRARVGVAALLIGFALAAAGCASLQAGPRDAVPEKLVAVAEPVGLNDVRIWGDQALTAQQAYQDISEDRLRTRKLSLARRGAALASNMLALSGGGDDGAFGAGLMVGWSAHGDRPSFDLVTGVSAGALIAPFAFLGKDYDRQLTEVFTRYGGEGIYQADLLGGLLGGPAIASNGPLKDLIAKYVDAEMLRKIAAARGQGRFLLIGTTNIDAQRPVFWDMGKIAASGRPDAIELFRSVLLASASIPGVFPPVRIRVSANGRRYDELHVDGGTTREVFFSPAEFSFKDFDSLLGAPIARRLFVIRNGKISPEWQQTEETAVALGERALATVLKNQAQGDIERIYQKARRDSIDYNLAGIPASFKVVQHAPFAQAYMQSLFKAAYGLGKAGYAWAKAPPGAPDVADTAAR